MADEGMGDAQQPAESLPDELWDALVVGAGPAGSAAAILLASRGHRVLLVERKRFPREKVCGDCLIADSFQCLRRLGLFERVREMAHEVGALEAFSPSRLRVPAPARYLALKRSRFDALLAGEAVRRGAAFAAGEVRDLRTRPDGLVEASVDGMARAVRARVCLLATGVDLALAKRAGIVTGPMATSVAIRCYVRSPAALDSLVTWYHPALIPGYAWAFPMGDGEFNVGCCALRGGGRRGPNLRGVLERFMAEFPASREVFRRAEAVGPVRGALSWLGLRGARPLAGRRVLGVGEVIGSTLPFTGEGIGKAMETAEVAAEVVDEALRADEMGALREYPLRLEERLRPSYMVHELAQKLASARWSNDLMARCVQKSGWARDLLLAVVSDEAASPAVDFSRRLFRALARLRGRPVGSVGE